MSLSGSIRVTTSNDRQRENVNLETEIAVAKVEMAPFARTQYESKYAWKDEYGNVVEDWPDTAERVVRNVLGALRYDDLDWEYQKLLGAITRREFMPGGRYLYASGRGLHQTQNCILLKAEDSREGWAKVMSDAAMALMTGAGIGVDYTALRASGTLIKKTGGEASGPLALMKIINEIGRNVMQGGARRSAIWAGLNWKHPDIFDFIRIKDWSSEVREMKAKDFNFPATLDMTNVSVQLDDDFFEAFDDDSHELHSRAREVYWLTVSKMVTTAEPGFSVDTGDNAGETLRNACTEVTSYDDSDICNLGSINLARVDSIEEFEDLVRLGTLFLLAGTVYSHVPYSQVDDIRTKNRRLGLGIMGVHEWLLKRDKPYGPDEELAEWMRVYERSTEFATEYALEHGLTVPVKTRAIAPNGTIGIVAETTTGIEPIFCTALKRRYRTAQADGNDVTQFQYVIDPTARRLVEEGVDPNSIEDAYRLSYDVERRVAFQAWMQQFVDHGISSTVNLPYTLHDQDMLDFGEMLIKYLPDLRGITCYPDGARSGQPLTAVPYSVAIGQEGVVFEEDDDRCVGGVCGS